jgi:hypothetical protein
VFEVLSSAKVLPRELESQLRQVSMLVSWLCFLWVTHGFERNLDIILASGYGSSVDARRLDLPSGM